MFDGYLDVAGVEIINSARATRYAHGAGLGVECDECPDLHVALEDEPYEAPHLDPAPWYDTSLPESAQFLGVMGMGVAGMGASTYTRTPVPLMGEGSVIGAPRRDHREIAFTVGLVARSEAGLSYGLEYLSSALLGGTCGDSVCDGDEACMFSSCPGGPVADNLGCEGGSLPPGMEPSSRSGDRELRHLFDVGLLEAPSLGQVTYLPSGFLWGEVTFTLVAGKPWIFREPVRTLTGWVPLGTQPRVGPFDPDAVYTECEQFAPCLTDPDCPQPPLPIRPPIPADPCYPGGPDTFRRALIELDPISPPDWLEMVPVIKVSAGAGPMRRLIVRFWTNNESRPCSQLDDPCNACVDLSINYLPTGALLEIDGRTQRASVGCPQGSQGYSRSTPSLFGTAGGMFTWPVFTCPTGLCVEVLSLASSTAQNARVLVEMVPRSDAA